MAHTATIVFEQLAGERRRGGGSSVLADVCQTPVMTSEPITAAAAGTWKLGDLTVNRMGFGAMRLTGGTAFGFGAPSNRDQSVSVLRRAAELGVNHIDTAAFYFSPLRSANELINTALAPYPDDVLRACGEQGVAFVPFFAIAGEGREAGAASTDSDEILAVAGAHGATPAQVRLAWTLEQGPHVLAIPGTGNPDHLTENVAAGALRLTPDDMSRLDAVHLTAG
jgi:aryl-alcohol dehydrogenase-like predicted oxidoreductase